MSPVRAFWLKKPGASVHAEASVGFFTTLSDGRLIFHYPTFYPNGTYGPHREPLWSRGQWGSPFPAGSDLMAICADTFPDAVATPAALGPGEYFPRMWRPGAPDAETTYRAPMLASVRSLRLLLKQMDDIFETIEPTPDNAKAFGHALRQLLFLACTDVESAMKGVLVANGYPKNPESLTTKDYVKLLKPMRLDTYTLGLRDYPDWPEMRPFAGWLDSAPSKSLPWYESYNDTKHDREKKLNKATLEAAIMATAAAYVMINAQFGTPVFGGPLKCADFPFAIEAEIVRDVELTYIPTGDDEVAQTPVNCPELV